MSTHLVLLALLMGLATYPSRAIPLLLPGMSRLPNRVLTYLRLVAPAVLAAIAALEIMVRTNGLDRRTSFHVGIEWVAVGLAVVLVAAGRSLLLSVAVGAVVVALARAAGFA